MKILYLCHRFPYPPDRGGKIRPFSMIQHFTRQGHQVTVAALARSADEARGGEGLGAHCARYIVERASAAATAGRLVASVPSRMPASMAYFYSPRLRQRIAAALNDTSFDLIFVHCSSVAPYVADVRGVPKVLDFGDMDSQKWLLYARVRRFPLSVGFWMEGRKLHRAEIALARKFDYCTCTTAAELQTLQGYNTGARCGWFPNGVDAAYFHPVAAPYDPDTICFVGHMDYFPNRQGMVEFCKRTLPLIRSQRPAVKLVIVGANPARAVRKLGALPGVTVTGAVPDVRPYVRAAAASVVPLLISRGTNNKILESMAMGVPVVASEQAAPGVDALPGEHLLTASTPDRFAAAILRLLESRAERERLAQAGRLRALSHHSWERAMDMLDAQLADHLGPRSPRRGHPPGAGGTAPEGPQLP